MLGMAPVVPSASPLMPSPLPPALPALLAGQFMQAQQARPRLQQGTERPKVDRVGRHHVGVLGTLHLLSRWG
jgi:hypothetical protein